MAPVLRAFRPELILVAAGQDASVLDPTGRMLVSAAGFRGLAERVALLADELCEGRLVAATEGGYSPLYNPFCLLAVVEGLAGRRSDVEDPWLDDPTVRAAGRARRRARARRAGRRAPRAAALVRVSYDRSLAHFGVLLRGRRTVAGTVQPVAGGGSDARVVLAPHLAVAHEVPLGRGRGVDHVDGALGRRGGRDLERVVHAGHAVERRARA